MNHIAIMKKSWGLIPKIISGEKTIESRWYKNRIAPWDRIHEGDTVYFKDSGEPVSAVAKVSNVLQFSNLDKKQFTEIMAKYADQICLKTREYDDYYKSKNYCILIFLTESKKVDKPFSIDKTGYGISSAWMCVENIANISVAEGEDDIRILQRHLNKSNFEVSKVEYTTGNYDEKGHLIKKKIPTITSEVGEIGVINGSYYLVLIFERNKLTKEFLTTLYQISECKIYGFKDFMKNLDLEAIFQEDLDESYIQIQFDGITTKQNHFLVELHYKFRKHFGEYGIYPINQIHKNMKL